MRRKVVDVKGDKNELADGLRLNTSDWYASIQHNVDRTMLAVSNRLKKMHDREAKALQQGVQDALCDAAGGTQKLFVEASEVVDRSLSLIVEHSPRDESAGPVSSSKHSASCERPQSQIGAAFDSGCVSMSSTLWSSAPSSSGATVSCAYLGRC